MRTVLNGPIPREVIDLLDRRRALGQDNFDEVWNGEYHMNPSPNRRHSRVQQTLSEWFGPRCRAVGLVPVIEFNLGTPDDFRVPDLGALRSDSDDIWGEDAAIVVEVLSPDDEAWQKFDHYALCGVTEVWMVEPFESTVQIFERPFDQGEFRRTDRSTLLGVVSADVAAVLDIR